MIRQGQVQSDIAAFLHSAEPSGERPPEWAHRHATGAGKSTGLGKPQDAFTYPFGESEIVSAYDYRLRSRRRYVRTFRVPL
jgi:hypothetical protein